MTGLVSSLSVSREILRAEIREENKKKALAIDREAFFKKFDMHVIRLAEQEILRDEGVVEEVQRTGRMETSKANPSVLTFIKVFAAAKIPRASLIDRLVKLHHVFATDAQAERALKIYETLGAPVCE